MLSGIENNNPILVEHFGKGMKWERAGQNINKKGQLSPS
jgi:hypothetical protein